MPTSPQRRGHGGGAKGEPLGREVTPDYAPPALVVLGSFAELTELNVGPLPDGGSEAGVTS